MIELAKPAIDVGLYTNDRDGLLSFWQQRIGLARAELLPVGGGVQQHRHAIGESVLKINHSREALAAAPAAGIRGLVIASAVARREELADPDGNRVMLVPAALEDPPQLRVLMTVSNLEAHRRFYGEILGFPEISRSRFACGASELELCEGEAHRDPPQRARGYRYLTIQVYDVKACHAEVVRLGGREGMAPRKLGDVAHISFVRDPDGNWIEISQRKSITGSLD